MALLKAIPRLASTRAWARWQLSDGSVIEMPLTTREYADLALRGAGAPARPPAVPADATWIAAAGGVLMWDTPDGRLPLGGYDQRRTDWVLLGLEELDPVSLRLVTGRIEDLTETTEIITVNGIKYRLDKGTIERLP